MFGGGKQNPEPFFELDAEVETLPFGSRGTGEVEAGGGGGAVVEGVVESGICFGMLLLGVPLSPPLLSAVIVAVPRDISEEGASGGSCFLAAVYMSTRLTSSDIISCYRRGR
jgi:hypothetical protein